MLTTHQQIIQFLNALKGEGFVIGIDTHLQVWTILQHLPADADADAVAAYLCPLFSQSEKEQQKFYEVFERHAEILGISKQETAQGEKLPVFDPLKTKTATQKPPSRKKYFLVGLGITALLIVLSVLAYRYFVPTVIYGCMDKNALNYNPKATAETSGICQYPDTLSVCMQVGKANYTDTSKLDTRKTIYRACSDCCVEKAEETTAENPQNPEQATTPEQVPQAKAQKDSTTYIVPFEAKTASKPNLQPISDSWQYWAYRNKTPIALALSLLLIGLLVAKWLYDKKRTQYNAQRSNDNEAPYFLPIKITNKKGIAFDEQIKTVFSQLRGREASEVQRLNIKKTVEATIKKGGFFDFRYQQQSRPSEYLILIDKGSELDHQAQLFEYVYQLIKEEEAQVTRYFYDADIRYCWNETHPNGITIERLTHLHAQARLMVFSDGYSFINRSYNEIATWLKPLEHWTKRALMTPAPMAGWNYREGILAQVFVVLPANIQGFLEVVEHFEAAKPSNLKAWKYEIGKADIPLELSKTNFIPELKQHFSPSMFRWIAACAVYPDLHWDLTIRIGHQLSEGSDNLVTHTNLIELTRLRWFQRGYMNLETREALLADSSLSEADRQKVRAVIVTVLEENIPENEKSYAFKEHQLQLAINKLLLERIGEDRKKWLKIIEAAQQQAVIKDPVSIQAFQQKENKWLGFQLPDRFVQFFFKGGIRAFGFKNWIALTFLGLGLCAIWLTHFLWESKQYDNLVALGKDTYSLATAQDTLDFYTLQEIWNFEQIANESPLRSNILLDWQAAASNKDDLILIKNYVWTAQYNAYVALYNKKRYANILNTHQNDAFDLTDTILAVNADLLHLRLDILQIVGLAEFYTQQQPSGTDFTASLNDLDDSTRQAYTQQNVPNLYHFLQYDFVDAKIESRVRVRKDDRYGFLDSLGQPTWRGTTPPYDYLTNYAKGRAIRTLKKEQCIINKNEQIINCFKTLQPYRDKAGKWGYVNENNTWIIEPQYDEARPFGASNAVVRRGNALGMIDKAGTTVLPLEYDEIGSFVTTRNIAKIRQNNRYGYISEDLTIRIAPLYSKAQDFEDNLTAAVTLNDKAIRINTEGQCVQGCGTKAETLTIAIYVTDQKGTAIDKATVLLKNIAVATDNENNVVTDGNATAEDVTLSTNAQGSSSRQIKISPSSIGKNINITVTKQGFIPKNETLLIANDKAITATIILNENTPVTPPADDPFAETMVFIQGGTFSMGSNEDDSEKPIHSVTVSNFSMGKYEVTQKQWTDIMGNNPSRFKNCDNCPVEYVSWDDIQEFLQKLNAKTGKNYRLPTEAEWEYAARGGQNYKYAGTDTESSLHLYANFCDKNCTYNWADKNQNDGYENTAPVGSFKPNGYGLYDMSGNVWEWCSDWYGSDYYSSSPSSNPKGPSSGAYRVLRGGSWNYYAERCRTAYRSYDAPTSRYDNYGFRLVLP